MSDPSTPRKKDNSESKYTSVQRSMDIFLRLTNLSMEWNVSRFVGTFVSEADKEKYWDQMHQKMALSILENIRSLKGCWVKLGQFLSTKSGFLPRYYLDALSQLQDYMPNSDFSEIIDTLEDDLGFMDDIYVNFDTIPIASASIAQVHKARLVDGSLVAVKVQHKSSEQNLMNDIEILKMITSLMHSAGIYPDIRDYFEEYASYAAKELDFTIETDNIQLSHLDVHNSKAPVKVPKLFTEYCSKHVITMEFFDLHKFTDKEFLEKYNVNLPKVIYDLHDFAFYQIMSSGRFHSDPHPGNLQLNYDPKDKKVYPVFLDWGFTTHVNDIQRIGVCKLYKSVYTFDKIGLSNAMMESGFILLDICPYRYDNLFNSLIGILTSSHRAYFGSGGKPLDLKASREEQFRIQKLVQEFIMQYFKKAPNFVPLSFKVLSEYQSLSKTVNTYAPFLHLIYKNASFALYSLYDSPLNVYYGTLGLHLLQYKLNSIRKKLMKSKLQVSFHDLLERLSYDSLKQTKNSRIFSELIFSESKNLLESRLADLFRYLNQDSSNVIAFQVAVIQNGSIDAEISFGNIDKYEKRPISNESLFPLFSMSSGLLTISVLHLASIGKIGLDDRVHVYWPEFKKNKEFVTIRDVLEHKCGVIYTDYPFFDFFTSREMMCNVIENAQFFYHNSTGRDYMFMFYGFILSEIITRVTKAPTEEFVLMLASMVGIDESNFLFPNNVPTDSSEDGSQSPSASSSCYVDEENEDASDTDLTTKAPKDINVLFEKSVSVFGENLPILKLFGIGTSKSDKDKVEDRSLNGKTTNKTNKSKTGSSNTNSSKSSTDSESETEYQNHKGKQTDKENKRNGNKRIGNEDKEANLAEESDKQKEETSNNSDSDSVENGDKVKVVSLDDNGLENSFRRTNLDIDEYRKNLSFPSTVIDIPVDENGQTDSTYYCYCYKYDKDFPDDELKRCFVPTKYCPTKNRLIKTFRGSFEDVLIPRFSTMPTQPNTPTVDSSYCTTITDLPVEANSEDDFSKIKESLRQTFSKIPVPGKIRLPVKIPVPGNTESQHESEESASNTDNDDTHSNPDLEKTPNPPSPPSEEIGRVGKMVRIRKKVCLNVTNLVDLEGYTLADLVRFNNPLLDTINVNYPKFYQNSIPYINARCNALSLSLIYYSVLSCSLVSEEILDHIVEHSHDDHSLLSRFFLGTFKPSFSYGFQKFTFLDQNNNLHHGFGHSDISGSVVMAIPSFKLSITLFTSHCTRQHVLIKILYFILKHYGLRLLGTNLLDSNFYYVLSCL